MDRNGKKAKAVRPDAHAERSDTKAQARDTLGRTATEARAQAERSGGDRPGAAGSRKADRP